MRRRRSITSFVRCLALSALWMLPACDAVSVLSELDTSGTNDAAAAPLPSDVKRVNVVLNNQTQDSVVVDIDLDDTRVTYPVAARQIISIHLKCADIFTFADVQFTGSGQDAAFQPVNQQARRDVDYDCDDLLVISIDDTNPQLKVVSMQPTAE